MKRSDFFFDLPTELIAQQPLAERSASRLFCLDGKSRATQHLTFKELPCLLNEGDLLVFNNTRVIPARLWGHKDSGGKVEILLERLLAEDRALAHIRASKSPKPGTQIKLTANPGEAASAHTIKVTGRQGELFEIQAPEVGGLPAILSAIGHMPLPPYIQRPDQQADQERYQTVFAQRDGAVAAPTAGLHFTHSLLKQLSDSGVNSTTITLHVGAGTFQPVRADDLADHVMHAEYLEVSDQACEAVSQTVARGKRVIAVGTTAVRALESASTGQGIEPFFGDTDIFIYPGYRFKVVDAMITNFHLPESTLLMLVSAFCGREAILNAYQQAVEQRYRFFSYGDAMFLTGRKQ